LDAPSSEYHHGDQDPSAQVATYRTFLNLTKWFSLHLAVLVLMLSIWFCTDAGFAAGLISGIVVLALGIVFLRSKSGPEV
jgi:thiamine transporter ThiT